MHFVAEIRTVTISRFPTKTGKSASVSIIQVPAAEPRNSSLAQECLTDLGTMNCAFVWSFTWLIRWLQIPGPVPVGFIVENVALRQYHSSLLSVSFHQCSKVISI